MVSKRLQYRNLNHAACSFSFVCCLQETIQQSQSIPNIPLCSIALIGGYQYACQRNMLEFAQETKVIVHCEPMSLGPILRIGKSSQLEINPRLPCFSRMRVGHE